MLRPSALCLALLAVFASSITPTLAIERPAKPAVGASVLTRVNGVGHPLRYHRRHRYAGRHNGFYANGYSLMYYVHSYPRGVSAKFGAPRCAC
jgi:hypothetical protein